ncbi:MAG: type II secretion system protein GspD, partial [Pseudomonadota bacterium]|nr:type II secretion system protein GspD [Pseudomonadota bacterium]
QQRYNQLYSLQLAMDKNGNFAKLPENVNDIYRQQPAAANSSPYQKVPTATQQNQSGAVSTPVAEDRPVVQQKSVALPVKETERSKNTVTTTTIRPASSQ